MKTNFKFTFPACKVVDNSKSLELSEGTSLDINVEYDPSEVIEYLKSLPQIISVVKESAVEVISAMKDFKKAEAEIDKDETEQAHAHEVHMKQTNLDLEIKRKEAFESNAD